MSLEMIPNLSGFSSCNIFYFNRTGVPPSFQGDSMPFLSSPTLGANVVPYK